MTSNDALIDFPLEAPALQAAPRVAQGIVCGSWALAFEFGWARNIVDQFDLVAVPQAAEWLVGAANVDGDLVPVIDMMRVISPQAAPFLRQPGQRLLVGGVGADALAIVFTRRPQMLRYTPEDGVGLAHVPASVRNVARGMATNERGETYIELDGPRLCEWLAAMSA